MNQVTFTVDPSIAGLKGKCPRCGKGPLFRNGLVLREECPECKLGYAFIDTGDGPAVFAIFIVGFLVLGAALIAEFKFGAPLWFHIVAWGIATPLLSLMILRWIKGLLIGQQYKHKAELGQVAKRDNA